MTASGPPDMAIRTNGLITIKLDDGDELRWIKQTTGKNDVIISTSAGQAACDRPTASVDRTATDRPTASAAQRSGRPTASGWPVEFPEYPSLHFLQIFPGLN